MTADGAGDSDSDDHAPRTWTRTRTPDNFWLLLTLIATVFILIVAIVTGIDQHQMATAAQASVDRLTQQLQGSQTALTKAQAENAALENISVPNFLRKYNEHIAELKAAVDAYDKAKVAKGSNVPGSNAAVALTHARERLNPVSDSFTDFIDRWRPLAAQLDQILDGNVKQLENSRRENNAEDVDAMAHRIINSAPDLGSALRTAVDSVKPPEKKLP
jgi:hypothetical protein